MKPSIRLLSVLLAVFVSLEAACATTVNAVYINPDNGKDYLQLKGDGSCFFFMLNGPSMKCTYEKNGRLYSLRFFPGAPAANVVENGEGIVLPDNWGVYKGEKAFVKADHLPVISPAEMKERDRRLSAAHLAAELVNNHVGAAGTLRTLKTAQATYRSAHERSGCSLHQLSEFSGPEIEKGQHGYTYQVECDSSGEFLQFKANPQQMGKTGKYFFCANGDGQLHYSDHAINNCAEAPVVDYDSIATLPI